jgi:uncharacterized protein YjiK
MTIATTHDPATAARITKNLELARRFTLSIFEDPEILESIPDGISLVLVPDDDEELARANLESALNTARSGRDVLIRHVRPSELPT